MMASMVAHTEFSAGKGKVHESDVVTGSEVGNW
jgi:hypothetical protein